MMDAIESDTRIAETTIIVVTPDAQPFKAKLAIGMPTYVEGVAFCTVYFDAIQRPMPIAGEDTLQALCLAIRLMRKLLEIWRDVRGWKFFEDGVDFSQPNFESEYLFDLDLLFGSLGKT